SFGADRTSLFGMHVSEDGWVVSADGQHRQHDVGAFAQPRKRPRVGRVAAKDERAAPFLDQEPTIAAMFIRQFARAPMVDLNSFDMRTAYLNRFAPSERTRVPEAPHDIAIAALHD